MGTSRRIGIVGAGFISEIHLEALKSVPSTVIGAVVDSNLARAQAIASKWGIPAVHNNIQEIIENKKCDVIHVLVPPDGHRKVAERFLRSGFHVFLEKPMATSLNECQALNQAAEAGDALLGINQNFVFHPAYLELKKLVATKEFGQLHHLISYLNVPLRQLAARQFSHWMFQLPQNLILEQAVHPLSQIYDLLGKPRHVQTTNTKPAELAKGTCIYDTWLVSMTCERATAQLFLSFGQSFPACGMVAICDDGLVSVDLLHNRVSYQTKSKWPEGFDSFLSGKAQARELFKDSVRNFTRYLTSTLRLKPRSDWFFLSVRKSIEAFYAGLDIGKPPINGQFGADIVAMCEEIAKHVADRPSTRGMVEARNPQYDIAVLGGTGFIGTHFVRRILDADLPVGVMARSIRTLPDVFDDKRVALLPGDTGRPEDIDRAIGEAQIVVHLAHGGGGATWSDVQRTMVDGARVVAEICLQKRVTKLIYISSIAALYLGDQQEVITGNTGFDPKFESRGVYARGKAVCERMLLNMHKDQNLPVCILRPGIVIGEGGLPFHSALGWFNQDQHCLAWNRGENPLPFVLVEDVAEAVYQAISAKDVIGRCYNLVGDVRLSGREYIAELGRALDRTLRFHPQSVTKLQALEIGKWLIKIFIGRRENPFPSWRDLKSRGMLAQFDCTDVKNDLRWTPTSDRAEFVRRGVEVYRKTR